MPIKKEPFKADFSFEGYMVNCSCGKKFIANDVSLFIYDSDDFSPRSAELRGTCPCDKQQYIRIILRDWTMYQMW